MYVYWNQRGDVVVGLATRESSAEIKTMQQCKGTLVGDISSGSSQKWMENWTTHDVDVSQ